MIKKLLLIEDDELTSFLMRKLVRKNGIAEELVIKGNGYEALKYLENLSEDDVFPNAIIVDIDMPVMNGYDFVVNYEKQFWKHNEGTYVLMATSSNRKVDSERALKNPCINEFVFKPITKDILLKLTESLPVIK